MRQVPKQARTVQDLLRIRDDAERARQAGALLDELAKTSREIAHIRVGAVQAMHRSGLSCARIGELLKLSRSRAQHLAAEGDVRDRALARKRKLN